jgi:hypothetical protein
LVEGTGPVVAVLLLNDFTFRKMKWFFFSVSRGFCGGQLTRWYVRKAIKNSWIALSNYILYYKEELVIDFFYVVV